MAPMTSWLQGRFWSLAPSVLSSRPPHCWKTFHSVSPLHLVSFVCYWHLHSWEYCAAHSFDNWWGAGAEWRAACSSSSTPTFLWILIFEFGCLYLRLHSTEFLFQFPNFRKGSWVARCRWGPSTYYWHTDPRSAPCLSWTWQSQYGARLSSFLGSLKRSWPVFSQWSQWRMCC